MASTTTNLKTTFSINYQKRKNANLFSKLQTCKQTSLAEVQNYVPIYDRFFSLNNNNYNSVNLNHLWYISDLKETKEPSENIFMCKLKNTIDDSGEIVSCQTVFIKMAPLLDPFKYIVGKYNCNDPTLFNLPSIDKSVKVCPKIADFNNTAYIDSFFSFLTSQVLNTHKFIHGLDFYGSFLAIKNNYKINIIDDIEYLVQSEFFVKSQNVLFNIDDYTHLVTSDELNDKPLKPLNIMNTSHKSVLSAKSIDDTIFENIFSEPDANLVTLSDIKNMNVELIDIMNSSELNIDAKKSETLKSGSSCSSRTSHTDENYEIDENDVDENDTKDNKEDNTDNIKENATEENATEENATNTDNISDYTDLDEETLWVTFPKFPIQLICMEHCENTFDNLIMTSDLSHDEWFSALMQIIMTLITYQKMFSFTHNDLHTNNVMYISTNKKFIHYCYKKKYYKVPTFGRIFKIIDFGRAIYKYNGKTFCSDSFQTGGDAATQYNIEPYFNDKKPRIEPNFSFDLCRLACSIFDYVIDDVSDIKNIDTLEPIAKLINDWCIDDNGINVLYKNNGSERYPDFKLYKMIARCVHKHTPVAQLERPEFNKFVISKNAFEKNSIGKSDIINIDELPVYIS